MGEILRTEGLTKRYDRVTALDGLSLSLASGRICGLIGPDGAGKTTLLRLLAGLCSPTEGSFSLFGERSAAGLSRVRRRVGFLIGEPVAEERFSLRENLRMQAILSGGTDKAQLKALRQRIGLTEREAGHRRYRDCAVWERKRYGLAAALLGGPELLILDEPMNGLDPEGCRLAAELLAELNREKGVTMLLTAAFPEELYGLATDYLFLDRGRLLGSMTASELEQKLEASGPEGLEKELLRLRAKERGEA